jgi:hypothetical protein
VGEIVRLRSERAVKILLDSGFRYRVYYVFDEFGLCGEPVGRL